MYPPGVGIIRNYPIPTSFTGVWTPFEELPEAVKKVITYDPAAARALLAETPWPTGFDTTVQYVIEGGQFEGASDALVMIKDYWDAIGVNLALEAVDIGTGATFRTPPFPYKATFASMAGGALFPVLNDYFKTGANCNRCVVSDPYIDEMIGLISVESDLETQNAMFKEVFTYIEEQTFFIVMPQAATYTAWWPWIKEFAGEVVIEYEGQGHIVSHIWIDQDLREVLTGKR